MCLRWIDWQNRTYGATSVRVDTFDTMRGTTARPTRSCMVYSVGDETGPRRYCFNVDEIHGEDTSASSSRPASMPSLWEERRGRARRVSTVRAGADRAPLPGAHAGVLLPAAYAYHYSHAGADDGAAVLCWPRRADDAEKTPRADAQAHDHPRRRP